VDEGPLVVRSVKVDTVHEACQLHATQPTDTLSLSLSMELRRLLENENNKEENGEEQEDNKEREVE
jgi:hypothetical protein